MAKLGQLLTALSPLISVLLFIVLLLFVQSQAHIQNHQVYIKEKKELDLTKLRLGTDTCGLVADTCKQDFWYKFDYIVLHDRDSLLKTSNVESFRSRVTDSTKKLLSISSGFLTAKVNIALGGTILILLLLSLLILSIRALAKFWPESKIASRVCISIISLTIILNIIICLHLSNDNFLVRDLAGSITAPIKQYAAKLFFLFGTVLPIVAEICVSCLIVAICLILFNRTSYLQNGRSAESIFINRSLYISASALGIAVLLSYQEYSCSSILVENPDSIVSAAQTLAIATGVLFSMLLLMMYLPIWLQAKPYWRGSVIYHTKESKEARAELLKNILAALLPAIVSVFLQLLGFKTH